VLAVVALRIAGFTATSAATRSAGAVVAIYAVPLLAIALSSLVIFQGPAVRGLNARIVSALRGRFRAPRLAAG
ncbi:LPS export ABC transporter permease LptF, partial [Methylobacterium sp. WL122]